jgi:hypothetical protein
MGGCLLFTAACVGALLDLAREWPKRRWWAAVPALGCACSVALVMVGTPVARRVLFRRDLPTYEEVVRRIESGAMTVPPRRGRIPEAEAIARSAYGVFASKDADGCLVVEFFTEGGFPVMHSGYLYCSQCNGDEDAKKKTRWPFLHQKAPRWFFFSD